VRNLLLCLYVALAVLVLPTGCKKLAVNHDPEISTVTGPDTVAAEGSATLTCNATDADGDSLAYVWQCSVGTLSSATGQSTGWQAPTASGTATITVTVTDGREGSDSKNLSIFVKPLGNRPPSINSVTGPDSITVGGTAELSCSASDPDGDALTYHWECSAGGLSSPTGQTVTFYAPQNPGDVTVTVVVDDGRQLADTASMQVSVKPMANRPPVVDSITGSSSVAANGSTTLRCFASDPDGDQLTFSWTCARGRVSPASGQTVNWIAPDTSGSVIITVTVRDGRGGEDVRTKTINVTKVTTTWIDTMVSVSAGSYRGWYGTMKAGYNVWGSFSVSQKKADNVLDINFYVLDSTNFYKWANNQTCSYVVIKTRSQGTSYSATIPRTCRYYVILDNKFSLVTPKIVTFVTKLTSP